MTDITRRRTQITQYETETLFFHALGKKYPHGRYHDDSNQTIDNKPTTFWFNVHVMEVSFTWFLE